MHNHHRELGTIADITADFECLGGYICMYFDFHGSGQTFQMSFNDLDKYRRAVRELCLTFGVSGIEEIKGKRAYALRAWPHSPALIVGVEAESTGLRFVRGAFYSSVSELEMKRAWLRAEVDSLIDRLHRAIVAERTVADDYVEWGERWRS